VKKFLIDTHQVVFGSNAQENSNLVIQYQTLHPNAFWYHLANRSSSHGFYLGNESLERTHHNIIGNILLALSKEHGKFNKMSICQLKYIKTTKTPGLVDIQNCKELSIKRIHTFDASEYKIN